MKIQNEFINHIRSSDLLANISNEVKFDLYTSYQILDQTRKINIFSSIVLIIFGLIGNSLIIYVFSKQRFRVNSSNVFLLCLAVNDSFFLVIHFFEDTIRTYEEIFFYDTKNSTLIKLSINNFIQLINVTDKFTVSCHLISYLRYVLRFISAYIIVAFTFQRLSIVSSPLQDKFKSKKSAWILVSIIVFTSLVLNIWVPFFFKIHYVDNDQYCEIKDELRSIYYMITNAYIFIIIIIPISSIFISNLLIIIKTKKADSKRKKNQVRKFRNIPDIKTSMMNFNRSNVSANNTQLFNNATTTQPASFVSSVTFHHNLNRIDSIHLLKKNLAIRRDAISVNKFGFRLKPLYQNSNQITSKIKSGSIISKMLILISFSYAVLNLPYLITW